MPFAKPRPAPRSAPSRKALPEVVDPVWLLKALGLCLVAALICGYCALCFLFYQGEWQLVLHPSRTVARTPAAAGLAYTDVHFDSTETGQPRLTGWWIAAGQQPATPQPGFAPRYAAFTVLYLHDGSGSLADTVPMLARLHAEGVNVFAIDYRGFGASDDSVHPSEDRMRQDSAAALDYLTGTHHISADSIIPYGNGLGAFLAAELARSHADLPAVILDNPDPDPASTAAAAHPSHVVPVGLLFGNQFDIAAAISSLATPKLLLAGGPGSSGGGGDQREMQALFRRAASPRMTVTLSSAASDREYDSALSRFLDQYLHLPAR